MSETAAVLRPLVRSQWQGHPAVFAPNIVNLQSDPGDYVGQGGNFAYSRMNSRITATSNGSKFRIIVDGREDWFGDFQMPSEGARLAPGHFIGSEQAPVIVWSGPAGYCKPAANDFTIQDVTYAGNELESILLSFTYQCVSNPSTSVLRGQISWTRYDKSMPEPIDPIPANLWKADPSALPESGNYIYLTSEPTDFVGGGREYLYTQANSLLGVLSSQNKMWIYVEGDQQWDGFLGAMESQTSFKKGYYPDLEKMMAVNGRLDWSGEGRGCRNLWGWFAVDSISQEADKITAIDLRFEQRCLDAIGWTGALRGQVHWRNDDTTSPPGPITPVPAGLWQPPEGATPASGNYVYLASDPLDYIGAGKNRLYTPDISLLTASWNSYGKVLEIKINGDTRWNGYFQPMIPLDELAPGYYGNLMRYAFNNRAKGGMDWGGDGRGCNKLNGWFAVDSVQIVDNELQAVDLRFEQHCEGQLPALRGKIHWRSDDLTKPSGPINPPPPDLWKPAAGSTPQAGNFIYLESGTGDYIGEGINRIFTDANSTIAVSELGRRVQINVNGEQRWGGNFLGMNMITQLQPGYYGNAQSYPGTNLHVAAINWWGDGRTCVATRAWFVIDKIVRTDGLLSAIDLRFEQTCEGSSAPLRGAIRWNSSG